MGGPNLDKKLEQIDSSLADIVQQMLSKLTVEQLRLLIGFADINKNLSQIDSTMLTPELLQMIAGTAGVNVTPALLSVLTGMLADLCVTIRKTEFIEPNYINVFDKTKITNGGFYSSSTYLWVVAAGVSQSPFISVNPGDVVRIKVVHPGTYNVVYKNASGTIFAGVVAGQSNSIVTCIVPTDAVSISTALYSDEVDSVMITINQPIPLSYIGFAATGKIKSAVIVDNNNVKDGTFSKSKMNFKTIGDYVESETISVNLFDKTKTTDGGMYLSTTQWSISASLCQSDFHSVIPGDIMRINGTHGGNYHVVYKNSAGVIFTGEAKAAVNGVYTYTVPSNAVSFSTALYIDEKDTFMITKNTDMPGIYQAYNEVLSMVLKDIFLNAINPENAVGNYQGKYLSLLGDSISTYLGYIPAENTVFYNGSNYGVSSVNQTWWQRLINQTGMQLLVNNSWSGSYVTGTAASSGGTRCTALHSGSVNPDVIIVYMGVNDFIYEIGLGTYDGTTTFPTSKTTFREAYSIMLKNIQTTYPAAEVYVCTLPSCEQNTPIGFPEANGNSVLLAQWNQAIKDLAELFSVQVIDLAKCGITYQNLNLYTGDWNDTAKTGLHPNSAGHKLIANKAIKTIDPRSKYSILT